VREPKGQIPDRPGGPKIISSTLYLRAGFAGVDEPAVGRDVELPHREAVPMLLERTAVAARSHGTTVQ
jgi:hypothetical protein